MPGCIGWQNNELQSSEFFSSLTFPFVILLSLRKSFTFVMQILYFRYANSLLSLCKSYIHLRCVNIFLILKKCHAMRLALRGEENFPTTPGKNKNHAI